MEEKIEEVKKVRASLFRPGLSNEHESKTNLLLPGHVWN